MDKSPEYIDMCAKARALQLIWRQERGDMYTVDMKTVCCWLPERPAVGELRNGYGISRCSPDVISISRIVWLPRLDQLMILAQSPQATFERTAQAFFDWCAKDEPGLGPPTKRFGSLEQMWLAFVMLRGFHLKWDAAAGWRPIGCAGRAGDNPPG